MTPNDAIDYLCQRSQQTSSTYLRWWYLRCAWEIAIEILEEENAHE